MRQSSRRQTKDVFDEHSLVGDIVFSYVPHLSLAYHVHRFDPLKRSPCRTKGAESLARSKPPFYRSMILLEDVVQVLYWSTTTTSAEVTGLLQLRYGLRVRRVPVHVDGHSTRLNSS